MAAATGMAASSSISYFEQLPSELKVGPMSRPSRILAKDGSVIAKFYVENRKPVELDQVSKTMKQAILSIEDSRFYEHGGVDIRGTLRAALNNILHPSQRQGASTITQQYVNNVLNEALKRSGNTDDLMLGGSKDIGDKLREAKLAIAVENEYSKDEILQGYLNIVYFNPNAFGIEAAANYFYSVSADELDLQQSAMLAGMVRGPAIYNPITHPENAKQRRNVVLHTMLEQDKITKKQYKKASSSGLDVNRNPAPHGCASANMAEYFCTYVKHLITNNPAFGETEADREQLLMRGGLTIKTTLDPRLQKVAQKQVDDPAPLGQNPDHIGTSLTTVQPGTGKILAMAQNTQIVAPKGAWSNVYNFNVDEYQNGNKDKPLGGAGGFQPGSTYKPITLAAYLKQGGNLKDVVDAGQLSYPAGYDWKHTCAPKRTVPAFSFHNFAEGWAHPMTVMEGIKQSINSATFATAAEMDLCDINKMAEALGIHNGRTGEPIDHLLLPSLIGGTMPVSPLTMANAFATFASGGIYCEPRAITSVTDFTGRKYDVADKSCERTVPKNVAEAVNYNLQEVLDGGSGYKIPLDVPAAAKTGTTDKSVQTWVVGYTNGLATASWVGNPDQYRSLNGLRFNGNGTTLDYVDGANFAGGTWQDYMNAVAPFYSTSDFPDPPHDIIYPPEPEPTVDPEPDTYYVQPPEDSDDSSDTDSGSSDTGSTDTGTSDSADTPPSDAPAPDEKPSPPADAGSGSDGSTGAGNSGNANKPNKDD